MCSHPGCTEVTGIFAGFKMNSVKAMWNEIIVCRVSNNSSLGIGRSVLGHF